MNKFKTVVAGVLAATMILSLTGCDEEPAAGNSNAGASNAGDNTPSNAPGSISSQAETSASTTTYATDAAVNDAVEKMDATLDNPDLEVTNRLVWMAWNNWEQDETLPAGVLFKNTYGIPENGKDPDRAGRIFEFINVPYADRYTKLATAIQSGDSPDLFPFEIQDFPYGIIQGRYQPIDGILDLTSHKWDGAREILEQFKLGGKYYCAVYEISFPNLMYYRKSVIGDLGLDDPRELYDNGQWTWDTFMELGREFQKTGEGKFLIDGYNPENDFVCSTGVPMVANNDGVFVSNLYDSNVERAEDLLSKLAQENLRYPRHELNGYSVNPKAWADGNILFYADGALWRFEETLSKYGKKYGWNDDEIVAVAFPRDPQASEYYLQMKQDALMWVKGSTNAAGVAAWIDCNVTTTLDPEVVAATKKQKKERYGWSDYNLDYIYAQCALDGSSQIKAVFDCKNGLGEDIAGTSTSDNPVERLTKNVYIQGESYTTLREENSPVINDRISQLNEQIAKLS